MSNKNFNIVFIIIYTTPSICPDLNNVNLIIIYLVHLHCSTKILCVCVCAKYSVQCHKQNQWTIALFVCFLVFFLGQYQQHMEIPRIGVELELELLAYATATAI